MPLSEDDYRALLESGAWTPLCRFDGHGMVVEFRTQWGKIRAEPAAPWLHPNTRTVEERNRAMFVHCHAEACRAIGQLGGHKRMETMAAIARRLQARPTLVSVEEEASD